MLVASTSPSTDEINITRTRLAWPAFVDSITNIYNSFIELGAYPKAFKRDNIIIISKPSKRDRLSPNTYRPFALFSYLGKGSIDLSPVHPLTRPLNIVF